MYDISYWLRAQAWMRPNKVAVAGDRDRWTYRELNEKVTQLAAGLQQKLGVQPGDRIGLLSINGPEYLLVFMAAARLGAVVVPLNWRLTPPELEYQLRDSGARRIFCSADYAGVSRELTAKVGLETPVQITGEAGGSDFLSLAAVMDPTATDSPDTEPLPGDRPVLIGYTSGTTGRPKGAVLTHANLFWSSFNNLLTIDIRSADVTITLLPMFHIGGLGLFTLPTLLAGGRVVIPDRFDPEAAIRTVEAEQVTIVMGVPTIHKRLLEAIDKLQPNLASVRMFYSGGAPCPVELIQAFHQRGLAFGQGYGLTETAPTAFMLLEEDFQRRAGTIGRPAPANRVRLVDRKSGRVVGPGEVGEITIKGLNVFSHYWNKEEATREAIRDGWFYTGDLARADEEGYVTIAGRSKEMIISGGENIYPVEVEQVMESHPQVAEAAVFGLPHPEWGEVPHAAVVLEPGASLTEEELKAYCQARLAKYKIPKRFHFISELPRNAAGKIVKPRLQEMFGTPDRQEG